MWVSTTISSYQIKSYAVCTCTCLITSMLKKKVWNVFFRTPYRNADSPSWTACPGWSRCRSRFWAPPPAPPPGSSPRACPRWRSWWTPPHSHFCPWLSGAPPEQLHVIKLVPVTTAVYCFCFCICKRISFFFQMYINKKPEGCQLIGCLAEAFRWI